MATDTAQQAPATDERIHRYATWIHFGPGAEDCDALTREDGEVVSAAGCADRAHFHAWCRLPNPLQHEEIRERAQAAKARHIRLLRDEATDPATVLDAELDEIRAQPDEATAKEAVVGELLGRTFWKSYVEATRDVVETVDDDGETKPYEHVEADQARFTELRGMTDEQRAPVAEEYEELTRHLAAYNDAVNARHEELRRPEHDALMERDLDDLLTMVRSDRVGRAADGVFMAVYSRWEWLTCTLKAPGGDRRFKDMEALTAAPPEVIEVLQVTFDDLEQTKNAGAAGN